MSMALARRHPSLRGSESPRSAHVRSAHGRTGSSSTPALHRQPPDPATLLSLQRLAGNHAVGVFLQRIRVLEQLANGEEKVRFDDGEPLPSVAGRLSTDPGSVYQRTSEERVYLRQPRAAHTKKELTAEEVEQRRKADLAKNLAQVGSVLFAGSEGGSKEGSFEYVANYLFSEVYQSDRIKAGTIWRKVWKVEAPPDADPKKVRVAGLDHKVLLQEMIDLGFDATWKALPVEDLVKVKVGNALPGKDMPVLSRGVFDYFSSVYHWQPWPETSGVGFHTTDAGPGAVAKATSAGGWGGLTATGTVDFFRKRYGLDNAWNPLDDWLTQHGPTFRKGVKDNELLSTVSIATAIHGSVRFPLADTPGRKGIHRVVHDGEPTFHMEVFIYAVRVGHGYATFAQQGENAFGEIAVGGVPVEDIIGWSKIQRWHPYAPEGGAPLTVGFTYTMDAFTRNPAFGKGGIYDRMVAAATDQIEKERALTAKPYEG